MNPPGRGCPAPIPGLACSSDGAFVFSGAMTTNHKPSSAGTGLCDLELAFSGLCPITFPSADSALWSGDLQVVPRTPTHRPFQTAHLYPLPGRSRERFPLLTCTAAPGEPSLHHPQLSPLLQLGDDFGFGKLRSWKKERHGMWQAAPQRSAQAPVLTLDRQDMGTTHDK